MIGGGRGRRDRGRDVIGGREGGDMIGGGRGRDVIGGET